MHFEGLYLLISWGVYCLFAGSFWGSWRRVSCGVNLGGWSGSGCVVFLTGRTGGVGKRGSVSGVCVSRRWLFRCLIWVFGWCLTWGPCKMLFTFGLFIKTILWFLD